MAKLFENVQPGDLIEARYINQLALQVDLLTEKVANLEAAAASNVEKVEIISLNGPRKLGSVLEVNGKNFDMNLPLNHVYIDDIPIVNFLPSSPPTKLVFNIPETIVGVPKQATLRISNSYGAATMSMILLPADQIPKGQLRITDNTGDLSGITILNGSIYTYKFDVSSETTIQEQYRIEAKFDSIVGSSENEWKAATTLVGATGNTLQEFITLTPFTPVPIGIKVTIPAAAQSVNLYLRMQSVNNDAELSRTSSAVLIKVNAQQETSDPRIDVKLGTFGLATKARVTKVDGVDTIEIPFGLAGVIPFKATILDVSGTYSYEWMLEPSAGTDWTVQGFSPSQPTFRSVGETENINMSILLNTASNAAHTELRTLVIKARRTDADSTGQFTSFLRIPIRGYVL